MNLITYKTYSTDWKGRNKNIKEIKEELFKSINRCENFGQLASILEFHVGYLNGMEFANNVRYKEVNDKIMKSYFKKANNKK